MNSKKKYDNMKEHDDEDELEITMDLQGVFNCCKLISTQFFKP